MKISVITATFNSATTIKDCINSIYMQSYKNIENIIIDGDSKDNTINIINSVENRVVKIISEPDNGIYDAMNKGINIATGDIIGILNSDDLYTSNTIIQKIIETFEETNCDAVYGNLDFVDPNNINRILRHWKSSPFKTGSFKKGWHPPHPTFFVKREVYKKYGVFDTSLNVSADFELMLRLIEKNKIKTYYYDETIVKMRYGGVSTTSLKGIFQGNKNILKAFKKNGIKVSPFYTLNRFAYKASQFLKR